MSTELLPAASPLDTGGDDLHHIYCECDVDRGLCGKDISAAEFGPVDEDRACVVCVDLRDLPCERCGG
jgi:hypothetical protein